MYSSTFSAWLEANIKTSWTPERARNSRVYSIRGVFARGRRHYINPDKNQTLVHHPQTEYQGRRSHPRSLKCKRPKSFLKGICEHLTDSLSKSETPTNQKRTKKTQHTTACRIFSRCSSACFFPPRGFLSLRLLIKSELFRRYRYYKGGGGALR